MTKYRLRDTKRQEALIKALPKFEEMFWRACYQQMKDDDKYVFVSLPAPDDVGDFCSLWKVALRKSDIEIVYDPKNWNNYPEVTPPTGVLMIVKREGVLTFCLHEIAFFNGKVWLKEQDGPVPQNVVTNVYAFKPVEAP